MQSLIKTRFLKPAKLGKTDPSAHHVGLADAAPMLTPTFPVGFASGCRFCLADDGGTILTSRTKHARTAFSISTQTRSTQHPAAARIFMLKLMAIDGVEGTALAADVRATGGLFEFPTSSFDLESPALRERDAPNSPASKQASLSVKPAVYCKYSVQPAVPVALFLAQSGRLSPDRRRGGSTHWAESRQVGSVTDPSRWSRG